MAKYLISFPSAAMVVPDSELRAVGRDAHAVIDEAKAAGVYVPRPAGATKNCASSGSTRNPKGDNGAASAASRMPLLTREYHGYR
jgi:hypothetical protein